MTPKAEHGEGNVLRLVVDARGEREIAGLRVVAAIVALIGGLWLLALPYPVPRAFAVAGLLFAAVFLRRAMRTRTRSLDATRHYLELGRDALGLREGDATIVVPWAEVSAVRIDDDRLVVIVELRDARPLEIEPRFQGLALHELGAAIQQAFSAARSGGGCASALDG
jgi:hypothetical protein